MILIHSQKVRQLTLFITTVHIIIGTRANKVRSYVSPSTMLLKFLTPARRS